MSRRLNLVTVRTGETTPHRRAGEPVADERVQRIESRLRQAQASLQALGGDADDAGAELKAASQELQSITEELRGINGELAHRISAADPAGAALQVGDERYRLIVEEARDYAIFTTDHANRIDSWPPGAATVFGWAAEEVLGRKPDFTFTPEDRAEGAPAWEFDTAREQGQAPDVRWHMRKDGSRVFIDGSSRALHDADGRFRGLLKIGQDTTERRRADERLRESEQRLRSLMEGVPQLVWRADRPGHWSWSSPQWTAYTGLSPEESRGLGWLDALHPEDRGRACQAWSEAERAGVLDAEWRLCGGSEPRYRWFHTRATPVTDKDARVEWIGASTEIEEAKRLQAHTEILVAELQHRVRNILAVVRSIARRTGDTSVTVEDYAAHLQGRISSLARTQNVLTRTPGSGVNLEELVGDELLAHAVQEDQVTIGGPPVRLQGKAAETLGLALHELATNAVKYGALAVQAGGLSVTWKLVPSGEVARLCLEWRETGVPLAGPPERRGFGRELIERSVPYELGATAELEFLPDGVRCVIEMPLSERNAVLDGTPGGARRPPPLAGPHGLGGGAA